MQARLYDAGSYLHEGIYMNPSTSMARGLETASGEAWPVRRWTSPGGGQVSVRWGVAMYPGSQTLARRLTPEASHQASDGVTGALSVNGVLRDSFSTKAVATRDPGADEVSFELDFERGIYNPYITLRNTGGVAIKNLHSLDTFLA